MQWSSVVRMVLIGRMSWQCVEADSGWACYVPRSDATFIRVHMAGGLGYLSHPGARHHHSLPYDNKSSIVCNVVFLMFMIYLSIITDA